MGRNIRVLLGTAMAGVVLVMATAIPALAAGPAGTGDQDRLRTKDCTQSVDCTQDQIKLQSQDCTGDKIQDQTRLQDNAVSGIRQQLRTKDQTC